MKSFKSLAGVALAMHVLAPHSAAAESEQTQAGDAMPVTDSSILIPAPADSLDLVPTASGLGRSAASDTRIFNDICGCISKRITIRRDSPDFQPVSWSVRTVDGKSVRPRNENRTGNGVVLDMNGYDAGVYIITLRDKTGRTLTRPLRVD